MSKGFWRRDDVAKSWSTCVLQVTGRLVAVMTTTPQRIEFIEPAIDSLLNQSRRGINILLTLQHIEYILTLNGRESHSKVFFFARKWDIVILVVSNRWAYGRTDYSNLSFELLPQKKSTESCEDSLGIIMRTAFFCSVFVGATEVSKKSQAFASRNTGRPTGPWMCFISLYQWPFWEMGVLMILGESFKQPTGGWDWGKRSKIGEGKWNSHYLQGFIHARWCRISLNQQYDVNVCYLFALNLFDQVMWRRKKCCFISWDEDVSGQRK